MYIAITNFNLRNATPEQYQSLCRDIAPQFAALPGLISKVWTADPATNTFGGIYTWQDRASYEAFTRSDLFKAMGTHPNLMNVTMRGFDVLEDLTRQTRGLPSQAGAPSFA